MSDTFKLCTLHHVVWRLCMLPAPPPSWSCAARQIRVESFVSRDILDKTMGSNVPVLRHLAEEAAQQKSRHVALVYGEWERQRVLTACLWLYTEKQAIRGHEAIRPMRAEVNAFDCESRC